MGLFTGAETAIYGRVGRGVRLRPAKKFGRP